MNRLIAVTDDDAVNILSLIIADCSSPRWLIASGEFCGTFLPG
jgi:hypothetical protein